MLPLFLTDLLLFQSAAVVFHYYTSNKSQGNLVFLFSSFALYYYTLDVSFYSFYEHELYQPIHPSLHPPNHPPIHIPMVHPSIRPFIHSYIHPSTHTPIHSSAHPSIPTSTRQ